MKKQDMLEWFINNNQTILIWVGVAAQLATVALVIFVGYQIHQTNQTFEITKKEFELTKRPWIAIEGSAVFGDLQIRSFSNEKNEEKNLEEFNKMSIDEKNNFNATTVQWSVTMKNFGEIPAIEIQGRVLATIGKKPMKTDIEPAIFLPSFNLMPNQERIFFFALPVEFSDGIQAKNNEAYVSFDFIYGMQYSKQEYRYGTTIKMTGGNGYLIQKTWDEKTFEDIKSELLDNPVIITNKS